MGRIIPSGCLTPRLVLLAIPHGTSRDLNAPDFTRPEPGPHLDAVMAEFRDQPPTPQAAFAFKRCLKTALRECGFRQRHLA